MEFVGRIKNKDVVKNDVKTYAGVGLNQVRITALIIQSRHFFHGIDWFTLVQERSRHGIKICSIIAVSAHHFVALWCCLVWFFGWCFLSYSNCRRAWPHPAAFGSVLTDCHLLQETLHVCSLSLDKRLANASLGDLQSLGFSHQGCAWKKTCALMEIFKVGGGSGDVRMKNYYWEAHVFFFFFLWSIK